MTKIIDLKDKKLIYYLSLNSRTSHTQLAKKVGLSKNSVKYRIEKLKKQGIIKQFSAVINLGATNHDTFCVLMKFNQDIYKDEPILNHLKNHKYADWIVILSGNWDLFVEFAAKDLWHMNEIVLELQNHFSHTLNSYELFFSGDTLRVEHLIEDFYKPLKLPIIAQDERETKKIIIDKKDKTLLNLLAQDSSLDFIQLSKKSFLSLDTVRYRIKNLIENKIIVKFFPEINLKKLDYTEYLYNLKLRNISNEKLEKLRKELSGNQNITYCFYDFSKSTMFFVCAFKSADEIDSLSRQLRKDFSEIIENQEYLIIKEHVLFNLFPKGLIGD